MKLTVLSTLSVVLTVAGAVANAACGSSDLLPRANACNGAEGARGDATPSFATELPVLISGFAVARPPEYEILSPARAWLGDNRPSSQVARLRLPLPISSETFQR